MRNAILYIFLLPVFILALLFCWLRPEWNPGALLLNKFY